MSNDRFQALLGWVQPHFACEAGQVSNLSGDASHRQYYRVMNHEQSRVLVDSSPEHENNQAFLNVQHILYDAGLQVPELYAADVDNGFMLLEDFGDTLYANVLNENNADQLYRQALDELVRIQCIETEQEAIPQITAQDIIADLGLFDDWFLSQLLEADLDDEETNYLNLLYENIAAELLLQPQVCVHHDYHSRNLFQLDDDSVGIIDFQDAFVGPVMYDVASLLRDCYVDWPTEKVDEWLQYYLQQALQAGVLVDVDFATLKRWFDWVSVARHLRVLGTFSRLHLRDNKSQYLDDVPRILNYLKQVTAQYPEFDELAIFLPELEE